MSSVGKADGGLRLGIAVSDFGVSFGVDVVDSTGKLVVFWTDVLVGRAMIFGVTVGEASLGVV